MFVKFLEFYTIMVIREMKDRFSEKIHHVETNREIVSSNLIQDFQDADINKTGSLTYKEFQNFLKKKGFDNHKLIKSISIETDENEDKKIDFLGILLLIIFYI